MSPMSPRLLRPRASGGFDPRGIAGLALWLDPSDSSTLPVGAISQLSDKSGNGRNFVQATTALQPTRTTVNGRTALSFEEQWMRQSAVSAYANRTNFVVAQRRTGSNPTVWGSLFGYRASTTQVTGAVDSDVAWNLSADAALEGTPIGVMASTGTPVAWVTGSSAALGAGSATPFRFVGTCPFAVANTTRIVACNTGQTAAGNKMPLLGVEGNNNTRTYRMNLCEVLVYSEQLSAADRQRVEGYLAWKWGVQDKLPYNHPYAASFPGYGSQTMPTDADALTYLAAVATADGGTGVEVGVANAVDSFVNGCKADGIWGAIKTCGILIGARTLSGALTKLVGPTFTNVNNNFVAGDYNRKTGLKGNASNKTIDTNLNHNTIPQNNIHMAVYASEHPSTGAVRAHLGAGGFNTGASGIARNSDAVSHRMQTSGAQAGISGVSYASGVQPFIAGRRAVSSDWEMRVNATTYSGGPAPWGVSQTPASGNIFVFDRIAAGGGSNAYSDGRLAFFSAGESLDFALLESRVNTLYAAIGAAI